MTGLVEFLRARRPRQGRRVMELARRVSGPTFVVLPSGGYIVHYPHEALGEAIARELKQRP